MKSRALKTSKLRLVMWWRLDELVGFGFPNQQGGTINRPLPLFLVIAVFPLRLVVGRDLVLFGLRINFRKGACDFLQFEKVLVLVHGVFSGPQFKESDLQGIALRTQGI